MIRQKECFGCPASFQYLYTKSSVFLHQHQDIEWVYTYKSESRSNQTRDQNPSVLYITYIHTLYLTPSSHSFIHFFSVWSERCVVVVEVKMERIPSAKSDLA